MVYFSTAINKLEGTGKLFQLEETLGSDGKYRPKRVFQNPPELRRPHDYYPTPPHATESLLERERFAGMVLEPACGDGAIVRVLQKCGYEVEASDLLDGHDFFARSEKAINVGTNPPYRYTLEFILHAKQVSTVKVAILLPVRVSPRSHSTRAFSGQGLSLEGRVCILVEVAIRQRKEHHSRTCLVRVGPEIQGEPRLGWIR